MAFFSTAFLNSMGSQLARSSCLVPFQWMAGILVVAIGGSVYAGAPTWVLAFEVGLLFAVIAAFLVLGVYFGFCHPEYLRSENYAISRLAIEKGLIGDDVRGMLPAQSVESLPTPPLGHVGHRQEDEVTSGE